MDGRTPALLLIAPLLLVPFSACLGDPVRIHVPFARTGDHAFYERTLRTAPVDPTESVDTRPFPMDVVVGAAETRRLPWGDEATLVKVTERRGTSVLDITTTWVTLEGNRALFTDDCDEVGVNDQGAFCSFHTRRQLPRPAAWALGFSVLQGRTLDERTSFETPTASVTGLGRVSSTDPRLRIRVDERPTGVTYEFVVRPGAPFPAAATVSTPVASGGALVDDVAVEHYRLVSFTAGAGTVPAWLPDASPPSGRCLGGEAPFDQGLPPGLDDPLPVFGIRLRDVVEYASSQSEAFRRFVETPGSAFARMDLSYRDAQGTLGADPTRSITVVLVQPPTEGRSLAHRITVDISQGAVLHLPPRYAYASSANQDVPSAEGELGAGLFVSVKKLLDRHLDPPFGADHVLKMRLEREAGTTELFPAWTVVEQKDHKEWTTRYDGRSGCALSMQRPEGW